MTGTKLLFHSIKIHRLDPINYKPISLLNAISRPYARFLYSNDRIVFKAMLFLKSRLVLEGNIKLSTMVLSFTIWLKNTLLLPHSPPLPNVPCFATLVAKVCS